MNVMVLILRAVLGSLYLSTEDVSETSGALMTRS